MARVFADRSRATLHAVANGDTLAALAATAAGGIPGFTWQELALYNWGTTQPREVNRAIFEQIGCTEAQINMANPENTVMTPRLNAVIRVPRLFTKDNLAMRKTHIVDIRPRLPAPAIRFDSWDKWFRPVDEKFQYTYRTEGVAARADKVRIEIRGSNYAKATPKKEGKYFQTFSYEAQEATLFRATHGANERQAHAAEWDGVCTSWLGVLAPRNGTRRPITVAHSPYTVLARYYLDEGDKDARIDLEAFWPDFDSAGATKRDSRKINYRVSETGGKLKWGQIVITDQAGALVRRIPLQSMNLSDGEHTVEWDGNNSAGVAVTHANMPYLVQIEGHSNEDEDNGLALAAIHTEVRLWVHSNVGLNANPVNDPQCLEFEPAAAWCEANPPVAGSTEWYKFKLERAGYHPGPVDDSSRDEFTTALKEYQRSHAVALGANSFQRLKITGSASGESQTSLAAAPADERPLFGDLNNNRADIAPRANANATLNDPNVLPGLAVWVDDRHSYTAYDGTPSSIGLGDYRGDMSPGDGRVNLDRESICRPWIPLRARFGLLSRTDPLSPAGLLPAATANTYKSIGPLRVDWTFFEPDSDYATVIQPSGAPNAAQKTRSRAWIGAVTGVAGPVGLGKQWSGRDYTNCPELLSGRVAEASFGPDTLATDPDADANPRNILVLRIDGKKIRITLTPNANLPLATAVNEINNELTAQNVAARASVNADGRLVVRSNGFGTNRSIRVRQRNDSDLVNQLSLAYTTVHGTNTSVADFTGGAIANLDTRPKGYLVLRVNGTETRLTFRGDRAETKAQVLTAIQGPVPSAAATAAGIQLQTTNTGDDQRLVVSSDSDASLLAAFGLQADTYKGKTNPAQRAEAQATFADPVDTRAACPHKTNILYLEVDGKAVDVELPEAQAVTGAQVLERTQMALKAAGVAATASLTGGGALKIETDGTGDSRVVKISRDTSEGLGSQLSDESGFETPHSKPRKGSGPVPSGGERPDDLTQYFKRIIGNGKDDSLRPWLAAPHEREDPAKNAVATIVHDDQVQDDDDFFVNQQGRAGVYFRPSRIGGDAYQLRAQVSFDEIPGVPMHPNWETLEKRYRRLTPAGAAVESRAPQAHTGRFRNWRKDTIRGYAGWTAVPNVAHLPGAQAIYTDAYLDIVHEQAALLNQFALPAAPLGPALGAAVVMTPADFTTSVRALLDKKGSRFRHVTPELCPGYVWPYLRENGYGFRPTTKDADDYEERLESAITSAWRTYRARLLQTLLERVEERRGLLRGHTLVEFAMGPDIEIEEYTCGNVNCAQTHSMVMNQPFGANGADPGGTILAPANCLACNGGLYNRTANKTMAFPKIAVGINLGATWLYQPGDPQTWAHEMGHHKHLQHAQGHNDDNDGAPGFSLVQHDSVPNPNRGGKARWHRRSWDCFCTMGYDKEPPQRFCGKCLLKLRGWAVEGIENPAGGVGGP